MVFVDFDVVWAVHWTKDKFFPISHIHWWEHVFTVVIPVTGSLIQFHRSNWWRINVLVACCYFFINDITFQLTTDSRTIWQPEWKPLTDFLRNHEQIKLFTKFTVVTFFSFFETFKICFKIFFVEPSCTIDTLHHGIVTISTPVSTCNIQEVEDLDTTS